MPNRFYCDQPLAANNLVALPNQVATHISRVLRLRVGVAVTLFNGNGNEYHATLKEVERRSVQAEIHSCQSVNNESPLQLTLVQAIGKGERMDWAVQKSVEMGIASIQPILTERTVVQLKNDRAEKRQLHWQQVVISACEQSGRNVIPAVAEPISLADWCAKEPRGYVLDPTADTGISTMAAPENGAALVVGPEGGFSSSELEQLSKSGIQRLRFGPRILRTETAGVAVLAALQARFGDCQ